MLWALAENTNKPCIITTGGVFGVYISNNEQISDKSTKHFHAPKIIPVNLDSEVNFL